MANVYYKSEGNIVYFSNQNQSGWQQWTKSLHFIYDTYTAQINLYNNKFILPEDATGLFSGFLNTTFNDTDKWDLSECKIFNTTFGHCRNLYEVLFPNSVNTVAENMRAMFYGCSRLAKVDLRCFTAKNVTNTVNMFYECSNLASINVGPPIIADWSTHDNLTQSDDMFYHCYRLRNFQETNPTDKTKANSTDGGYFDVFLDWIFYKIDGDTVYLTNDGKDGYLRYTDITHLNYIGYDKYYIIEPHPSGGVDLNVFKVIDRLGHSMFRGALNTSFNDINKWDLQRCTYASYMFAECPNLVTLNLNTKSAPAVDCFMEGMFSGCSNLTSMTFGSKWASADPYTVTSMFENCSKLTSMDLSNLGSAGIYSTNSMFNNCVNLTTVNMSGFTTITGNCSKMFRNCKQLSTITNFNLNTSRTTDMSSMFENCELLSNTDYSFMNTSKVQNFSKMFKNCRNITSLNITSFTVPVATDTSEMFCDCDHLNWIDAGEVDWDISGTNITTSTHMFYNCAHLAQGNNGDIHNAHCYKAKQYHPAWVGAFKYYYKVYVHWEEGSGTYHLSNTPYPTTTSVYEIWSGGNFAPPHSKYVVDDRPLAIPGDASFCFAYADSIQYDDGDSDKFDGLEYIDFSNCTNMNQMFYNSTVDKVEDTESWNLHNVNSISGLFKGCSSLTTFDASGLKTLKHLTDHNSFNDTFQNCSSLTGVNLRGVDTSIADCLMFTFQGCSNLREVNLLGCDFSNVAVISYPFDGCSKLSTVRVAEGVDWINDTKVDPNGDHALSGWDMFRGCTSIRNWNNNTTMYKANTSSTGYFTGVRPTGYRYTPLEKMYEKNDNIWIEVEPRFKDEAIWQKSTPEVLEPYWI